MKAVTQRSYGLPDVLALEDVDQPAVGDNQVSIRVKAASLNAYDWHMLRGKPYLARMTSGVRRPKRIVPGVDISGVIEAVGATVTRFKPGDEVFGPSNGALAEYAVARETNYASRPTGFSFEQAAAVPMAGVTAIQALRDRGRVHTGQKVLIIGASGGVGTFAVQIAKAHGADVTAVCSTRNVDTARSIGADRVIDYTKQDVSHGEELFDLILKVAGDASMADLRRVLTKTGTLVAVGGEIGGNWVGPLKMVFEPMLASAFRPQKMATMLAKNNTNDLEVLADLMEAGKLTPVIDRVYPLDEAREAFAYIGEGHAQGKVVITI